MKLLIFVCTGNTCRSNVAEVLALEAASRLGLSGWRFSSAGIMAFPGSPASENSLQVMQEHGLDLSHHRTTLLDQRLVQDADLILAMTPAHKAQIVSFYPASVSKVFTLLEYAGDPGQVQDPFGGDIEVYRRTAAQIKDAVEKVIKKLKNCQPV